MRDFDDVKEIAEIGLAVDPVEGSGGEVRGARVGNRHRRFRSAPDEESQHADRSRDRLHLSRDRAALSHSAIETGSSVDFDDDR
jgi:hypothetical protein